MERIVDRLLSQAYLFDDPRAYEAGVRDAVEALREGETQRTAAARAAHPSGGRTGLRNVADPAA